MALWWVGDAIFILVVIPILVILLHRLARTTVEVAKRVDTLHDQVRGIAVAVDDVKQLIPVRDAVKEVAAGITRYMQAVSRIR